MRWRIRLVVLLSSFVFLVGCSGKQEGPPEVASPGGGEVPAEYTLRLREPKAGDVRQVERVVTTRTQHQFLNEPKEWRDRKNSEIVWTSSYRETILDKPAGAKRPTRLRRDYARFETKFSDRAPIPEADIATNWTVHIEKLEATDDNKDKGDKDVIMGYRFTSGDKKPVPANSFGHLQVEFGDSDFFNFDGSLLLPRKPVRVGETWAIDPEGALKEHVLAGSHEADLARAKCAGKLTRVYTKEGRQYGLIEVTAEYVPTHFNKTPTKEGANCRLTFTLDGCIDGSRYDAEITNAFKGGLETTGPLLIAFQYDYAAKTRIRDADR